MLRAQATAALLIHQHGTALCAQLAHEDTYLPSVLSFGIEPEGDPWGPEYLFYTLDL